MAKVICAISLTLCLWVAAARAEDWPQWRGPLRNGTSPETGWNADWRVQPPKLTWTSAVGRGVSLPVVVGSKVYIFGRTDGQTDEILCLGLDDGKVLWRKTAGTSRLTRRLRHGLAGPVSTPAVSDGRLFTYHRSHDFRCWSAADGKLLWEVNLQSKYGLRSSKTAAYWTPGNSPLVLDDMVIISGHGTTGAVALNTKTGELLWKAVGIDDSDYDGPRPQKGGANVWTSPTPLMLDKRMHVLLHLSKDVVCLDAATGKEVWRQQDERWPGPATVSDPILAGDLIVAPGYRRGEGVGRVLDRQGNVVRHLPRLLVQGSTPVARGDWVFAPKLAVNAKTAESVRTPGGTPIIVDGHVIALSSKELSLFRFADGRIERLGSVRVKADRYAAPVFSDGRILFRSASDTLACWTVPKSILPARDKDADAPPEKNPVRARPNVPAATPDGEG
jgi:outer membrane protein assembly factor BamB